MSKIKLLVDAHVFDFEYQGTRSFIEGIYNQDVFKINDIEVYLVAYDIENLKLNFPLFQDHQFIKFKFKSKYMRLLFELPYIIYKYKIDYFHLQYISPIIKNCKFIVTTHDVIFNDNPEEFSFSYRIIKNSLYYLSAKYSDIVTTVSEFSKKSIHQYLSIPLKDIIVVPNGVNQRYFNDFDFNISRNKINSTFGFSDFILYVSRIEPRKNHYLLLKSYLDLKLYLKGIHLVFIGKTSLVDQKLNHLIDNIEEDAKSFFHYYENVNNDQVLEFYRAARLFVYPSKAEGFGIPPLEAAALSIPTLCSNQTAMKDFDFFEDRHFNPNDFEEFKNKLYHCIEFENLALTSSIKEKVKKQYNWKNSANIIVDLIKKYK